MTGQGIAKQSTGILPLYAKQNEAIAGLLRLFSAYPEPYIARDAEHADKISKARVAAYKLALDGLPAWAIELAVSDFIQGRVDRRRRDLLPTAEEVAARAREEISKEASRQMARQAEADQRAEIAEMEERQRRMNDPSYRKELEERAKRVAEMMKKLGT